MDKELLVDKQVEAGRNLVLLLDKNDFPVSAAVWFYYHDIDRWSLLIATTRYNKKDLKQAYIDLSRLVAESNDNDIFPDTSQIKLVKPDDPIISALRMIVCVKDLSEVRLSSNMINNIYIEDALVYRNAA